MHREQTQRPLHGRAKFERGKTSAVGAILGLSMLAVAVGAGCGSTQAAHVGAGAIPTGVGPKPQAPPASTIDEPWRQKQPWAPRAILERPANVACKTEVETGNPIRGTWKGGPLFSTPSGSMKLSPFMASLCVYDWYPGGGHSVPVPPTEADYTELGNAMQSTAVEEFGVVSGMQNESEHKPTAYLAKRYKALQERVLDFKPPAPPQSFKPETVTIAVIDAVFDVETYALANGSPAYDCGNNAHGFNVARLARAVGCANTAGAMAGVGENEACTGILRVSTWLALPYVDPPTVAVKAPSPKECGSFGTRSHVASRIYEATNAWARSKETPHLVLNLSLGWAQPVWTRKAPPPKDIARESVEEALKFAACAGALTFAAAGNNPGYKNADEILYPAAFEKTTGVDCTAYKSTATPQRPLVVAIGGVDDTYLPIVASRKNGIPRLVAPGLEVVATTPDKDLNPMTGTSAASAVASGIAARVWSMMKSADADQVYKHLSQTAVPLKFDATFCGAQASCGRAAFLSYCGALGATPCPPSGPPQGLGNAPMRAYGLIEVPTRAEEPYLPGIAGGQPIQPECPSCSGQWAQNVGIYEWNFGDRLDGSFMSATRISSIDIDRVQMFGAQGTQSPLMVGYHGDPATNSALLAQRAWGWTWLKDGSLEISRAVVFGNVASAPSFFVLTFKRNYENGAFFYTNHTQVF